MNASRSFVVLLFALMAFAVGAQDFALVIHGGAGYQTRDRYSSTQDQAYRESLTEALLLGQSLLKQGVNSVEVVEKVITLLENDSLFNSGRGSVLNKKGAVECDASIMNGANKNAGAIAGVSHIKNPITTARLVMEKSPHVMLSGIGAENFAKEHHIEMVENSYFITHKRKEQFQKKQEEKKHGTVGAVALDQSGNIAAGTSTGGMADKSFGRIGDSPVIGAGTYADNSTCGISCTGHGEYFIRYAVAYDMAAMMEYKNMSINDAADAIIQKKLKEAGGNGGLIGLDKNGNIVMEYNTPGMFRGYITADEIYVGIYKDE